MKILVTGSTGHLGEAICRTLQQQGIDFIGLDIKEGPLTTNIGSIADRAFVQQMTQGVDYILHTATLHKPHVATHTKQDFVEVNITGTLNLLEEAKANGCKGFIFTSTTSTFGDILTPAPNEPAVWVTEDTVPVPKNIYGVTKTAAEDLCQLFYRNHGLPCIILKTSRFFPEEDDNKHSREAYEDLNIKANEFLHRRVDIEDVVSAHLLAIEKAASLGFQKYIISATSPFTRAHLADLQNDAPSVVRTIYPEFEALYKTKKWKMFPSIGRVYVNEKARKELGWQPKHDFGYVLSCLKKDQDFRSSITHQIGSKGYHEETFEDGPFPVENNE
ncbi:MAG TPA: NAD-dependent epimerase [Microscillaceae bacterium]|nr:NAD-dependent epimerase [Microscillaceae bacterium]